MSESIYGTTRWTPGKIEVIECCAASQAEAHRMMAIALNDFHMENKGHWTVDVIDNGWDSDSVVHTIRAYLMKN